MQRRGILSAESAVWTVFARLIYRPVVSQDDIPPIRSLPCLLQHSSLRSISTPSTCSPLPSSSLFSPSSLSVSFSSALPLDVRADRGYSLSVSFTFANPLPLEFYDGGTVISVIRETSDVYARQAGHNGGPQVRVPPHRACASNPMTRKNGHKRYTQDLETRVWPPKGRS